MAKNVNANPVPYVFWIVYTRYSAGTPRAIPTYMQDNNGIKIIPVNKTNAAHLEQVIADMRTMGAPEIRCIWSPLQDCWQAIEGSHRLAAAEVLGMDVTVVDCGDSVDMSDEQFDDLWDCMSDDARFTDRTAVDAADLASWMYAN